MSDEFSAYMNSNKFSVWDTGGGRVAHGREFGDINLLITDRNGVRLVETFDQPALFEAHCPVEGFEFFCVTRTTAAEAVQFIAVAVELGRIFKHNRHTNEIFETLPDMVTELHEVTILALDPASIWSIPPGTDRR